MANAAIKFALEKLGNLITQEAALISGVRDEVEWLQTQLRWMECFLIDADRKQKRGDERVKNWVREVRDVAYQVEDAVETFMFQIETKRQQRRGGGLLGLCKRYACFPSQLKSLHNISAEIERIRTKVRQISESRVAFGIVNLSDLSRSSTSTTERFRAWRQVSPHLDDDAVVVGFDGNKKVITERLLDDDTKGRCVISIVGMGGLGKTTLATKIYNSSEIMTRFPVRAWISVSQDYKVSDLFKKIIKMITILEREEVAKMENMDEEELNLKLYEVLKDRRYLIVMDDIWDSRVWEQIKSAFPNAENGSRVLLTTRFLDVAKAADRRFPPFELALLSDEQSWELFLRKVFPPDQVANPSCPEELENVGRELVKRCGRLPLAVVVLGGLLLTKDLTYNAWRDVARSMDWEATNDGKECLQILALSYNDLPDHRLKSCFVYIGSFPEDFNIEASMLVRMWMAEGFIPKTDNQTIEDTGMKYIEELIHRCMIQVGHKRSSNERVKFFRIHDLFRDLCISIGRDEGVIEYKCGSNVIHDSANARRRLVLTRSTFERNTPCFSSKPRSILGFNIRTHYPNTLIRSIFRDFKLLRVLHLSFQWDYSGEGFRRKMDKRVPAEITSLIHLRYLKLSCHRFQSLPSSTGKLCNLQTLDIAATKITRLPRTLWKIQTLRHVLASSINNFCVRSSGRGHLANLRTLVHVEAGRWIQDGLASLSNLRELGIWKITLNDDKALCDSLPKLNHLNSLVLHSNSFEKPSMPVKTIQNLEDLHSLSMQGNWSAISIFPKNLFYISLGGCVLKSDSIAALEKLAGLEILILDTEKLVGRKLVCSTGGFPRLQNLHIYGLIESWLIECGAMPNLAYLRIDSCYKLVSLPPGLEYLHSLKRLELYRMYEEFGKRAGEGGEDWDKIRHIPSVDILYTRPPPTPVVHKSAEDEGSESDGVGRSHDFDD